MDIHGIWESIVVSNMDYVTKLPVALFTFAVAYLIFRAFKKLIGTAISRSKFDQTLETMVLSAVSFVGWILIMAAVLNVLDLGQLSLALGGSIALIAMALATGLNSVAQDLLSGIFLLGDEDFGAGKRVRAGGVEGEVVQLSIRKTKIRDKDGNLHTVPNRNIDGATYVTLIKEGEPEAQSG